MIRNFANAETEKFFTSGKSRRLPPDILKRATMRMTAPGNGAYASMTNGACVFGLKTAMLTTLRSSITTKENHHD